MPRQKREAPILNSRGEPFRDCARQLIVPGFYEELADGTPTKSLFYFIEPGRRVPEPGVRPQWVVTGWWAISRGKYELISGTEGYLPVPEEVVRANIATWRTNADITERLLAGDLSDIEVPK